VATNLVDFEADEERIRLLNANLATSWSHRATAAALLFGAGLAAIRALRAGQRRRCWGATATGLIVLLVIEVSSVHVQVDRLSYGKLVYVPLLVCLVVCVLRLLHGSEQMTVLRAALACLMVSYAVHVLGPSVVRELGWGTDSWAYQVKVGLKEGLELSGWVLLMWALWRRAAESPYLDHRLGASSKLARWAVGRVNGTD
jgi:hypothetical protein